MPSLNADIIDQGVARGDTSYILRTGMAMLAVALAQVVATVVAVYLGARCAMGLGRDLRAAVFHRVGSFSSREVAHFGAPSLITRTTNDVQQVQMLVLLSSTMMVTAPIMMMGGVVMALREDLGLSWLVGISAPALLVSLGFVISRMLPGYRFMQARVDAFNKTLREQITGIRVVRAFVREPFETSRFDTANLDLTTVALSVGRWMAVMFPLVFLILNLSSVAVLWFGGQRVDAGQMQTGSMTAFLAYLIQILIAVMMATFMLVMVPRAAVSADRISEVLDTESSVPPPVAVVTTLGERATARFSDVEFSYPGASAPVLRGGQLRRRARSDDRHHRFYWRWEDHIDRSCSPVVRRDGGSGQCRRGRRSSSRPGAALEQDRIGSAAGVSVLGHGRLELALRPTRRDGSGAVGRVGNGPSARVCRGDA